MSYKVIARYGAMGLLGEFTGDFEGLHRGDRVVLRTDRGTEAGEVVDVSSSISEGEPQPQTQVLRLFGENDQKELLRIDQDIPKEMAFCRERIKAQSLPMKLVDAEHLLGGEKIIFYFVADGRVDFRQLVKDIAREYKTRIELRQIGVRDEARLLSELGHCGQRLCCKSFMKDLEPVTMRMAKSQKATLDPTKISGVCGRLMCCLRYEDKVYSELKAVLPKRGAMVVTRKCSGKIVDMDVLAQILSVRTADGNVVRVPAGELVSVEGRPSEEPQDPPEVEVKDAATDAAGDRPANSQNQGGDASPQPRRDNGRQPRHNRNQRPRRGNGR